MFFRYGDQSWYRINIITGEWQRAQRLEERFRNFVNNYVAKYYKDRFNLEPPVRIVDNEKVLIPNFEYDTRRKKYRITLYDQDERDFCVEVLLEHLKRYIKRRVFIPLSQDKFIMNFRCHHVIAEILETPRWFQLACNNKGMIRKMLDWYAINRSVVKDVEIVDHSAIIGKSRCSILNFIDWLNSQCYNEENFDVPTNGPAFVIEDDNIFINDVRFEIRKTRTSKYYVRGFDEDVSREIMGFFKKTYPDQRTVGVFPEFKTKEDLVDFILKLRDDTNIFENISQTPHLRYRIRTCSVLYWQVCRGCSTNT